MKFRTGSGITNLCLILIENKPGCFRKIPDEGSGTERISPSLGIIIEITRIIINCIFNKVSGEIQLIDRAGTVPTIIGKSTRIGNDKRVPYRNLDT